MRVRDKGGGDNHQVLADKHIIHLDPLIRYDRHTK